MRFTPQEVIAYFYEELGFTDSQIALLVSAHAGHYVAKSTIVGIRTGRPRSAAGTPRYTGRNLAPALAQLAHVWRL